MKFDLAIDPPLMNAAGSLGFEPNPRGPVDMDRFGAFVTNPISRLPRRPAAAARCLPFPGGFVLHTGYPNPGLARAILRYGVAWERASLPVIVHLLANGPEELPGMVRQLERLDGLAGIELGLPPEADAGLARALIHAAQGELPVIACLPFERAVELAPVAAEAGAAALSLSAPRGVLPLPGGGLVRGRLYGPAVLPLALATLYAMGQALKAAGASTPMIGAGGAYRPADIGALRTAGAWAVQLDAVLWRGMEMGD